MRRKAFHPWQPRATRFQLAAILLSAVAVAGVSWAIHRRHQGEPAARPMAALNPEQIRTQLEKSIQDVYDRDAADARKLDEWKGRQKKLRNAEQARDDNFAQVDDFLASTARSVASGQPSLEYLELSRQLQEKGVNSALEYLMNRESQLLDHAGDFHRQRLNIAKERAAADPANVQPQHDLSVSYERLGNASQQSGQWDVAREFYQQGLDIRKKLASADPGNSQAQRDVAVSYEKLGDVSRQAGRLDVARDFYQQGLDVRRKLAAAGPRNAEAQRELMYSYYDLASLFQATGDFNAAIRHCELGIAVLEPVNGNRQRAAQPRDELEVLQKLAAQCRQSRTAVGAWDVLLKQPAAELPGLLNLRCHFLAQRRDIDGVAQSAEALRTLKPVTPTNLYDAARGYGLCAKLAAGRPGHGSSSTPNGAANVKGPDPKSAEKSQQRYVRAAIDLLQAAVKAGYKNFARLQREPDLAALRNRPEFEELLTNANHRGR